MNSISSVKNGTIEDESYVLNARINVDSSDTWVLDLALNQKENCSSFAVSLSNFIIKLFSTETRNKIQQLKGHDNKINGIKFCNRNNNLLLSGSQDGSIKLWDLRENNSEPVTTFIDDANGELKPIISFDVNRDDTYICGGTEIIREDAFLLFWDIRKSECLGGYWNSHTDDVTQIKYHPSKSHVMASGSVDGLINIFNLNQSCEADALETTLNTDSSVGKIMWKPNHKNDKIFCLTLAEEIQAWNCDDAQPYVMFDRNSFCEKNGMKVDYLVDTLQDDTEVYIVTGNRSNQLQIWSLDETDTKLCSHINNAHKEDTRAIAWNAHDKTLYTGGEDGTVCIWKTTISEPLKVPSGMKKSRLKKTSKPY